MRYLWNAFLGLVSLGFLGLICVVLLFGGVFIYYSHDLPDHSQLKTHEPDIVTRLYAGDGRLVAEFSQEKRVFVPIENIPDHVKQAFIAAEDQNFYTHKGVDLIAIARAMVGNVKSIGTDRRPQGASTITQQVAKNFLLTNELSYERKIKEAILAYRMEQAMSKDQILELYLNEIFMGARAYGVAAAALTYFNKALEELSIAEAAYLGALPKAPNNYHPVHDHDDALARRNWVISRMAEEGFITDSQADLAQLEPLQMVEGDEKTRQVSAPFFAEEIRRALADLYGEDVLYRGGLVVRSTLNAELQNIAEETLREGLKDYDRRHGYRGPVADLENTQDWKSRLNSIQRQAGMLRDWQLAVVLNAGEQNAEIGFKDGSTGRITLDGVKWARECLGACYALGPVVTAVNQVLNPGHVIMVSPRDESAYELEQVPNIQGALIAMDPHTGRILAMQGGWDFRASEFNRATQAMRQTGSAFKPFVYIAALERSFTPATLVLDAPIAIEDRPGNFWSPSNYSKDYYGPTPIRVGVEKSKNLMTVRLAEFLGMETIADYARRFDIVDDMPPHLSMALGAGETTLLKLTAAYGKIVNGGKDITPTFIDRIQNRHGKTIFAHDDRQCPNCGALIKWQEQGVPGVPDQREQIIDPRVAYQMTSILEGVVKRGTGIRIAQLNRPLAGKTGTTNESKDTWFIGFSPDLVVGVFAGFDEPRSLGKRETGSSVAVPIFKDFMEKALKDAPIVPFRVPEGIRQVQINAETGQRARPGDEKVIWEAFIRGTEPTENMYILDGTGINLFTSGMEYDPENENSTFQDMTIRGTGGLY